MNAWSLNIDTVCSWSSFLFIEAGYLIGKSLICLDFVTSFVCEPNPFLLNAQLIGGLPWLPGIYVGAEVFKFMKQMPFPLAYPCSSQINHFCMRIPQPLTPPVVFHSPHGSLKRKYLITQKKTLLSLISFPLMLTWLGQKLSNYQYSCLVVLILLLGSSHKGIFKFCHLVSYSFYL